MTRGPTPRMKENAVFRMGRRCSLAAATADYTTESPSSSRCLANEFLCR